MERERKDICKLYSKYKSEYVPKGSVELDLGYMYCHSVLGLSKIPWPNNFNIDEFEPFKIQTFKPEELWASKIIAMIGVERIDTEEGRFLGFRNKIRHLYDVHYLVKNILPENKFNIEILKKLTILFGATRVKLFELCRGDALLGHDQDEYEKYLKPVLRAEKYVYELLTMQRDVRTFLDENIFNYTPEEIEFMQDFTNRIFRPNKIFDDKIAQRLTKMFFYEEMLNMIKL